MREMVRIVIKVYHVLCMLFHMLYLKCTFKYYGVEYSNYKIYGKPFVEMNKKSGDRIVFGDGLKMNNGMSGNQIGYSTPCIFRTENGKIILGKNVGLSQAALIAKNADIVIGDNVKIGGGCKLYTSDFHSLDYMKRRTWEIDKQDRKSGDIEIGEDCFIGAGVIILKDVHIGSRSIIGAGSVVTKDIPSDCIAGGNPCRIIRHL